MQNLVGKKKKEIFKSKLKECKSEDLWKVTKSPGLPNKSGGCTEAVARGCSIKSEFLKI